MPRLVGEHSDCPRCDSMLDDSTILEDIAIKLAAAGRPVGHRAELQQPESGNVRHYSFVVFSPTDRTYPSPGPYVDSRNNAL